MDVPFVSLIKINGVPITIPPFLTVEERIHMQDWRKKAINIEKELARKSQNTPKIRPNTAAKRDAIPAKSENFEERPQSRNVADNLVIRKPLNSAENEKSQEISDILKKMDSKKESTNDPPLSPSSGNISKTNSSDIYASSTEDFDLKKRPDEGSNHSDIRGSYKIEVPSAALVQSEAISPSEKPFGHLGSMVARYLTEQQRVKHISEYEKLQSILQEQTSVSENTSKPSEEVDASSTPPKSIVTSDGAISGSQKITSSFSPDGRSKDELLNRLAAVIRGYLVRRVMKTQKVQHCAKTIKDCQHLLTAEKSSNEEIGWRHIVDTQFKGHIWSQLEVALEEFHEILFGWPLPDRLGLIAKDEASKGNVSRPASTRSRPLARKPVSKSISDVSKRRKPEISSRNVNGRPSTAAYSKSPREVPVRAGHLSPRNGQASSNRPISVSSKESARSRQTHAGPSSAGVFRR